MYHEEIDFGATFISLILMTSIGQTFFASVLLIFSNHPNKKANIFLALFMLSLCGSLCLIFSIRFWFLFVPQVIMLYAPLVYTGPIFLWRYTKKLTSPNEKLKLKNYLLHFLPAIIVTGALIPFYMLPGIEKLEWFGLSKNPLTIMSPIQQWTSFINPFVKFGAILFGSIYFYFIYQALKRHKQLVENEYSNTELVSLNWLRYITISLFVIYAIAFTLAFLYEIRMRPLFSEYFSLTTGPLLLSVFGYFGITQQKIREHIEEASSQTLNTQAENVGSQEPPIEDTESVSDKYRNSTLSNDELAQSYTKLLAHIEQAQPYLSPELHISELADQLDLPSHELSRIINERAHKNFMEFINYYRVEDAKQLLVKDGGQTVLEIAMSVGFNSKSAFYTAFKKNTNLTPTQYKKKHH